MPCNIRLFYIQTGKLNQPQDGKYLLGVVELISQKDQKLI